jgi:hypothetical protein
MTMTMDQHYFEARNLLRAQMASKGITLTELSALLTADGAHEELRPLSAKINRGKFSFAFFLRCMKVLGMGGGFFLLPRFDETAPATRKSAISAKVPAKSGGSRTKTQPKPKVTKRTSTRKRKEADMATG